MLDGRRLLQAPTNHSLDSTRLDRADAIANRSVLRSRKGLTWAPILRPTWGQRGSAQLEGPATFEVRWERLASGLPVALAPALDCAAQPRWQVRRRRLSSTRRRSRHRQCGGIDGTRGGCRRWARVPGMSPCWWRRLTIRMESQGDPPRSRQRSMRSTYIAGAVVKASTFRQAAPIPPNKLGSKICTYAWTK